MKTIISNMALIFFLISCNLSKGKNCENNFTGKESAAQIQSESIFYYDTLSINDYKFVQTIDKGTTRIYCLTTINGDTIIPFADYYSHIELLDINDDNNTDIRVFIFSNTYNQCNSYLFDIQNNVFKLIENCDLDIQKITGTSCYYSYNAVGCADMNWESHLSTIENYQLVTYGRIYGNGCNSDDELMIKIYKIIDEKEIFFKTLPYTKYIPKFDSKWNFIKKYWETYYRDFI
jgi:hypothetical protein